MKLSGLPRVIKPGLAAESFTFRFLLPVVTLSCSLWLCEFFLQLWHTAEAACGDWEARPALHKASGE